jgi:predicted phage-related endonuclease
MADAMSFRKDGKPSADRTKYLYEVVAERLTDIPATHFVTPAMQWGIDHEDEAKMAYEKATGRKTKLCGTFDHFEIDNLAATPDSLIGPDGLAEFKCPTTPVFVEWVNHGVVPEQHKPQLIVQLMCTGREWNDFVAFDPRIKGPRRLFIVRYIPTPEEVEAVRVAAIQFLNEADSLFEFMSRTEPA